MLTASAAVVVVGNHTQGLGIARSAAAAGAPVWVVNDQRLSLVRFSRRLTGYRRLPHGTLARLERRDAADALKAALLELPVGAPSALLGVDEDIGRFIQRHRETLAGRYFVPAPLRDGICDKLRFSELVPAPARIETRLWDEAAAARVERPERFVVKGRSGNRFRRVTGQKAIRLDQFTPSARAALFRALPPDQVVFQLLIVTERPVTSVCSFSVNGEIAGLFGYEKLRQHPNQFGTGTYLRSVDVAPLRPVAEAVLREFQFTGVSEIEFIHDAATDAWKVIEMNPRAWKSVHFATQCGVNLVGQLVAHVRGERPAFTDGYARNRHWVDLASDIPQMFRERRWGGYARGFYECVWNRADPLPWIALCALFPLLALEGFWARRARTDASTPDQP